MMAQPPRITVVDFAGAARTIPLFVIEWFIVLVGFVGNIIVIIVIAFYNGIKKPVNKLLFINLAIADLGFLVVRHPFIFLELFYDDETLSGVFTCEVLEPISMAFFPASLLIIMTISYYRHQAIVYFTRAELSMKKGAIIVTAIWLFTVTFYPVRRIPFSELAKNSTLVSCKHKVPTVVHTTIRAAELTLFCSVIFCTFILFIRMRRALLNSSKFNSSLRVSLRISQNLKTIRVLKPVIIVLFITTSPISALDLHRIIMAQRNKGLGAIDFKDYILLHHILSTLMLINSSANPFIYAFASREFRTSFQRLFRIRLSKNRINPPMHRTYTIQSTST